MKLARDQETGKSKGFGWLKYEDQRSTDLAVDNLGGAQVGGRMISVDHARYKARDDEDAEEFKVGWADIQRRQGLSEKDNGGDNSDTDMGEATPSEDERKTKKPKSIRSRDEHQPLLREERELQKLIDEHDDEDPMKDFLIEEKKKEVDEARKLRDAKGDSERRHHHRSHRSHRSRRDEEGSSRRDDKDREHRHRRRDDDGESRRERSDRHRDRDRDHDRDRDRKRGDREDGDSRDRRRERDRERDRDRDRERDRARDHDKETSHRRRDRDRKDDRDDRDRDRERRH